MQINFCQHSLIGARASSVFLSNCTIWVEGITDRLYIRKYFEIYQASLDINPRRFREDYHYSFVEYGGNNITHWSFLDTDDAAHPNINVERLCAKLFLITDRDGAGLKEDGTENMNSGGKKYERHIQLQQKLGERYVCLDSREIENLLRREVVKEVIKEKEKNPEIDFSQFDAARSYSHQRLGRFIKINVPDATRKYEAKSGTIEDKLGFCKTAIEKIKSLDDLSEEAKALCKKLYDFIATHNN